MNKENAIVFAAVEWREARKIWIIGAGTKDWRVTDNNEDLSRFSRACAALEKTVDALHE